ncbi:MAG: HD domain-containing protein [Ktedonobacteraceae bacterium]|nr:HD domain-containing protein [Ktedonobacteraceae bacterium]
MKSDIVPIIAHHVQEMLGDEGFRSVSAVVANCKLLTLELGDEEVGVDTQALMLAGYLHDISTAAHGFSNHHISSAEMAVKLLRTYEVSAERISKVERAILAHATAVPFEQRRAVPVEGRILYDADKLGRISGLAVVTSLIDFGARYPNRTVTSEVLAAVLRHVEEGFVELYQSLYTEPARALANEKFGRTLAFLDGVIEHLSEATPV